MKTRVFVFVPYALRPARLAEAADELLAAHRRGVNDPIERGRFDYLVGFEGGLCDAISEGRLPDRVRRSLAGRVCETQRLPPETIPGAVVTPDGAWHDLRDHGWRMMGEPDPNDEATAR
jgi:hypothetical protein